MCVCRSLYTVYIHVYMCSVYVYMYIYMCVLYVCAGYSWLSTWLHLELTKIQKWATHNSDFGLIQSGKILILNMLLNVGKHTVILDLLTWEKPTSNIGQTSAWCSYKQMEGVNICYSPYCSGIASTSISSLSLEPISSGFEHVMETTWVIHLWYWAISGFLIFPFLGSHGWIIWPPACMSL